MKARIIALATVVVPGLMAFTPAPVVAQDEAATFDVREFTCPLGGKSFTQEVGYFPFPLLQMPDGSWLGDTEIGVQIPVCPDNGLVILPDQAPAEDEDADGSARMRYLTYSAPELAALPALIADPEYRALKSDGGYSQAWWIADKLEHSPLSRFVLLQRSTWATRDPALRKKLVARFAEHAPALVAQFPQEDMRTYDSQLLIVNALRELGRFDEALAYLDTIDSGTTAYALFGKIFSYADQLRLAIGQRDDGRFAAETLPDRMVGEICGGGMAVVYGPITAATKASCKIRLDREAQEEQHREESFALLEDKPALIRKCADVAPWQRDNGLTKACEMLQDELNEIAANELTKDGPALAAKCDASEADSRDGVMRHACLKYGMALASALGDELTDDPEAFALFCPGEALEGGASELSWLSSASCVTAEARLKGRAEQRLLADPVRLAGLCAREEEAAMGNMYDYEILLRACSTYEMNQEMATVANLASDAAAFDSACGRFRNTNGAGNEVYELTEPQRECRNAWRLRENDKARATAEAKGLKCFNDAIYSPDRPRCVSPEEYALEMAPAVDDGPNPFDLSYLDEGSSLMEAAHVRAAAIIAEAKRTGRRPDEL